MLSLFISLGAAAAAIAACIVFQAGPGETTAAGLGAFLVSQILTGWVVRKKIMKLQEALQDQLLDGRRQVERKIHQFQSRPGGNIKQMQRQIEADQKRMLAAALQFVGRFEPFRKWSPLMGRQIETMRMQFLYQLKDFTAVDKLLAGRSLFKGPLMMEPMMVAMQMARQFECGDLAGAEKTFNRHIKWFRANRGTLLYALMSWIYMKQGESEKARMLLAKGKKITGDETLSRNWELLSNNKDKLFSNAGLGEEWFGLYLEVPPMPRQQRVRMDARGGRPF